MNGIVTVLFVRGSSRGGENQRSVWENCVMRDRGCEGALEGYTYTVCQVCSLMGDCDHKKRKRIRALRVCSSLESDGGRETEFCWAPLVPDTQFLTNGGSSYGIFCGSSVFG